MSTAGTDGARSASRTSWPRDRAVSDVRPRRFERATTSPVPLAPIHVPPAFRSRGATTGTSDPRREGGAAGRIAEDRKSTHLNPPLPPPALSRPPPPPPPPPTHAPPPRRSRGAPRGAWDPRSEGGSAGRIE